MSGPCLAPIAFETLVAYWANDLDANEAERVEEHLMGCAVCTAASAGVAAVRQAVASHIPPVVTRADVDRLRARGMRITSNPVRPGERKDVVFPADMDIVLHELGGLDLTNAQRVDVTVSVEETGAVLGDYPDTRFDRDGGVVLIACQRHFRSLPPNIVFVVETTDAAGRQQSTSYRVPHVFL